MGLPVDCSHLAPPIQCSFSHKSKLSKKYFQTPNWVFKREKEKERKREREKEEGKKEKERKHLFLPLDTLSLQKYNPRRFHLKSRNRSAANRCDWFGWKWTNYSFQFVGKRWDSLLVMGSPLPREDGSQCIPL